ncbi:MAG: Phosphoesterase PA-phosphatase related protein [Candidatus Collierbacteria bacterium GW2011_GWC2_44_18]|uniref:Phosphoesterase PA-phosphatase related protein n=2 Tax=Microgenomates group TaxID=1794810 RepID=A0A0G1J805_9BACT|nr:MAG: phosphoesterase PA-phosphatase related protein [Microgenomates group bacterium GW2011_GWC1_44_10]KKT49205.1 MAG: Phosphoesterase PA-phosphatase related protein [Candidatus Collierbacteria bacterium GW2011_GWC2_44_18]KKT67503.1 MAG: Phosphoesterase PA-phosphatase related protein [Candidatus Woesebacteria bacterium GW2011_GWA2_44_33]
MKMKKLIKSNNYLRLSVCTLIAGFIFLGIVAHRFAYFGIDLTVSQAVQSIHNPIFSLFMNVVSEIGDDFNLVIIVVLAMPLLFLAGLKVEAIKTALLTASAATVGSFVKSLVNRPRPGSDLVIIQEALVSKSFPSLHVLTFAVFFGYMLYLALYKVQTQWLKIFIAVPSTVLILTIGISRIYLGAHWASDVVGGYLLGAIFLVIAINLGRGDL